MSIISNTVNGRRHLKLFTNCHVSWDTQTLHVNCFSHTKTSGTTKLQSYKATKSCEKCSKNRTERLLSTDE